MSPFLFVFFFSFLERSEWEIVYRLYHRPAVVRQIYSAQSPVPHGSKVQICIVAFDSLQNFADMHLCFSTMKLVEGQSKTTKGFSFTQPFPLRRSLCFLFIQQPRRRCMDVLYWYSQRLRSWCWRHWRGRGLYSFLPAAPFLDMSFAGQRRARFLWKSRLLIQLVYIRCAHIQCSWEHHELVPGIRASVAQNDFPRSLLLCASWPNV